MISLTRKQISEAALSLVDVPFLHQGRDETIGLDCAGVLVAAFRKLGVTLRELPIIYHRLPAEEHVVACLEMNFAHVTALTWPAVMTLDSNIVHLRFNRDTEARHLGIIVPGPEEPMIVHSLRPNRRVTLDTLRGALSQAEIVGIYQWPTLQS